MSLLQTTITPDHTTGDKEDTSNSFQINKQTYNREAARDAEKSNSKRENDKWDNNSESQNGESVRVNRQSHQDVNHSIGQEEAVVQLSVHEQQLLESHSEALHDGQSELKERVLFGSIRGSHSENEADFKTTFKLQKIVDCNDRENEATLIEDLASSSELPSQSQLEEILSYSDGATAP